MDIINRLRYFMDFAGITISQFADTCGIPRPTMSQLMNGRNKRISDEVINKIHAGYPQLSILWLMFGEGEMVASANMETLEAQNRSEVRVDSGDFADLQGVASEIQSELPLNNDDSNNSEFEDSLFESTVPASSPSSAASQRPYNVMDDGSVDTIHFETRSNASLPYSTPSERNFGQEYAAVGKTSGSFTGNTGNSGVKQTVSGNVHQQYGSGKTSQHSAAGNISQQDTTVQGPVQPQRNYSADMTRSLNDKQREEPSTAASGVFVADASSDEPRVSISPDAHKKITNIVVFYSDNSFQSFLPDL